MRQRISKYFGRLGNNLFQYAYIYGQFRRGAVPDVYVQDYRYFDAYRDEIKEIFGKGSRCVRKVGVHVRRGDYVGNTFYTDLWAEDYYRKAMSLFPDATFLIFSDDIGWCKANTTFVGCEFSEGDEDADFENLMQCEGIICANSSFSWWAAYLSEASKVVAPKKWYTDGVERTKCPPHWVRV